VKITLSLVLPCLVTCAAGVLSCSSTNPSNLQPDSSVAAKDGGGGSATSDGSNSEAAKLDAQALDALGPDAQRPDALGPDAQALDALGPDAQRPDTPGPEATLPVDAVVDRIPVDVGSDVRAIDAGVAPDAAIIDGAAPQVVPDGGGSDEAGLDAGARDANATEARAPDATPPDASAPDAKVDTSAADVMVMDATVDGPTPSPDAAPAQCGRIQCDCTYKGINLWGNVQYVTNFPDFKIKTSYFPDLNVEETNFPLKCGQWHTVTAFPDFTVQIVDMFEDFDIAYSYFPGIP
jgi:hypothetical protein